MLDSAVSFSVALVSYCFNNLMQNTRRLFRIRWQSTTKLDSPNLMQLPAANGNWVQNQNGLYSEVPTELSSSPPLSPAYMMVRHTLSHVFVLCVYECV